MKGTPEERFWNKVGPHSDPSLCWIWLAGFRQSHGLKYGVFGISRGRGIYAHRFVYELLVGPIPKGMTIDHVKARGCTNTLCVNPAHLEIVTRRENILRGTGISAINARKTHCKRGHPFNKTNTYNPPNGGRKCRACKRIDVK